MMVYIYVLYIYIIYNSCVRCEWGLVEREQCEWYVVIHYRYVEVCNIY